MSAAWKRLLLALGGSPGLCRSCKHARLVNSDRDQVFLLCEAHSFNPRLDKYPALPVWACESYELQADQAVGRTEPSSEIPRGD
jgi:hypothetical protein